MVTAAPFAPLDKPSFTLSRVGDPVFASGALAAQIMMKATRVVRSLNSASSLKVGQVLDYKKL